MMTKTKNSMTRAARWYVLLLVICGVLAPGRTMAIGGWRSLATNAPGGVRLMLLLPDGTVMAQQNGGSNWYRLTPDITGSYIHGVWSTNMAAMHYQRTWYSSQVLRDGRVFVAGAEYSNGGWSTAEVYDPVANVWTLIPIPPSLVNTNIQILLNGQPTAGFSDSPSQVLPDGTVIVAPVYPIFYDTVIFDPVANTFSGGPPTYNNDSQDEASWVQLADGSILTIDKGSQNAERYMISPGRWLEDTNVPVALYDPYGTELGPGFLLPNGKAFYIGSSPFTATYTPSGNSNPGTWTTGTITNGLGAPDAPAAMLVNGKILCALSPTPFSATNIYTTPTYFYEYNYTAPASLAFTPVSSPANTSVGSSSNIATYNTMMLDLPDGTVLYSDTSSQLYVYQPDLSPLVSGRPTITGIGTNIEGVSYHLTGTLLNGISSGAAYGDDAQMNTAYPLVRMTDNSSGNVYYARTYNWSSTRVMTGNTPATTEFTVPGTVPPGSYSLVVVANGNPSAPVPFTYNGPVWVDFTYNSIFQFGIFEEPYQTLAKGTNAVASRRTIAIKGPGIDANSSPAISHETMTINKPMTITAVGGAATVGQQ